MFRIFTLCILLSGMVLADGEVLKTGQTQSYDTDGNVIADGSVKDDGYYQAGRSRSYSRSGDIVIDNITGLQWEDNETIMKPWVTQANYDDGNYSDTSGDSATTYCENFTLGTYDDWRLPSIEELHSISDYGQYRPAVTTNVFNNVNGSYYYWTSNSSFEGDRWALSIYVLSGQSSTQQKSTPLYVRCVRGGNIEDSNLSRNDVTEIVTDNTTELQWQDDSEAKNNSLNMSAAIDYCENTLQLGTYSDWRLPNVNELLSIVDFSSYHPAIDTSVFVNYLWIEYVTSSSSINNPTQVWYLSFNTGAVNTVAKDFALRVRCVRAGKRVKQGTDTYLPGTPTGNPGTYLPNCDSGRLTQGTTNECNTSAVPVTPPGLFLPTCPNGKRLTQGTDVCSGGGSGSNIAPTAEDLTINAAGEGSASGTIVISDAESPVADLTVVVVTAPIHGTIVWNTKTNFTYTVTHGSGYNGDETFTYYVQDPEGLQSATKTVTIEFVVDL